MSYLENIKGIKLRNAPLDTAKEESIYETEDNKNTYKFVERNGSIVVYINGKEYGIPQEEDLIRVLLNDIADYKM